MTPRPNRTRRSAAERIGVWSFRRRRTVVVACVLAVVGLSAVASMFGGEYRQSFAMPGSETQAAADLLSDAGFDVGGHSGLAVLHADDVHAPAVASAFASFLDAVEASDVTVVSPYTPHGAHQVSSDDTVAFARLDFGDVARSEADSAADAVRQARDDLAWPDPATVELGGELFFEEAEFSSEGFGLLAAAAILLVAFGSALAMGLPITTALIGIGCAFAVVGLATRLFDIPPFTPGVIVMIGLGAGIDYALLIVTRYREELAAGGTPEEAVRRSMSTAGRSTLFAGATVVTSLLGLLLVGLDDVRSLALAAAAGVLFVMLASITLLPALLGFVGVHIDRFGLPNRRPHTSTERSSTIWYRWSRRVQRRPILAAAAAVIVLLTVAAPVATLRLGLADASARPETDTSRRAHDLVAEGFGPGFNGPLFIAVGLPERGSDHILAGMVDLVGDQDGVDRATAMTSHDGAAGLVTVIPTSGPQEQATTDLVRRLRGSVLPRFLAGSDAHAFVGGPTAAAIDFADQNARILPWFITVVLAASFVLLMVVFRSVLVPLKAVLVNLLTVGAAYGAVVAIFQWGWLSTPLGLGEPGPVEAWVPMMLFAIVFGLSIDYEVFLIARIQERYRETRDNARAVAEGLAHTARLITAAAAIMICVFGAFALSDERPLQMLGIGLAVALAFDATLVRLVLVPATMQLTGDRNWWLPQPLARALPHLDLTEASSSAGPNPAPERAAAG